MLCCLCATARAFIASFCASFAANGPCGPTDKTGILWKLHVIPRIFTRSASAIALVRRQRVALLHRVTFGPCRASAKLRFDGSNEIS